MAYSYKGAIAFGLVYIPVMLTAAIRENDIGFNMLEKNTLSRVKYQKTCVDCDGKQIDNADIVKGYQYEKDKYVIFSDADFEKIKSKKDKNITINSFVNLNEIDPIYFDRTFYVNPTGGEKAYSLLVEALEKESKAGIAKTVIGTKENLMCLHASKGRLVANSLYFHDEIQKPIALAPQKTEKAELDLATSLINNMSGVWEPSKYHDEYHIKLKDAIQQKIAGKELEAPSEDSVSNIINIMDALKKSVEMTNAKKHSTNGTRHKSAV